MLRFHKMIWILLLVLQNRTAAAVSRCRRSVNSMKATVYMMVAINDLWPFVSL